MFYLNLNRNFYHKVFIDGFTKYLTSSWHRAGNNSVDLILEQSNPDLTYQFQRLHCICI